MLADGGRRGRVADRRPSASAARPCTRGVGVVQRRRERRRLRRVARSARARTRPSARTSGSGRVSSADERRARLRQSPTRPIGSAARRRTRAFAGRRQQSSTRSGDGGVAEDVAAPLARPRCGAGASGGGRRRADRAARADPRAAASTTASVRRCDGRRRPPAAAAARSAQAAARRRAAARRALATASFMASQPSAIRCGGPRDAVRRRGHADARARWAPESSRPALTSIGGSMRSGAK